MIRLSKIFCLNEIGGREQNEDSVWPLKGTSSDSEKLFMVCDGVGGSSHGEVASSLTCESFSDYFTIHLPTDEMPDQHFITSAQLDCLEKFEHYIVSHPSASQMSTTLTLAHVNKNAVFIAWCGDSRIYHIREGKVIYKTNDHSLVNQLVKAGEITEEQAINHPQKNIIIRAIQLKESPSEIECHEIKDIRKGDYILLCSDGLLENINEEVLFNTLHADSEKNPADYFNSLCEGNTRDNYSMYLLELDVIGSDKQTVIHPSGKKTIGIKSFAWIFILMVIALATYYLVNQNNKNKNPDPGIIENTVQVKDLKASSQPSKIKLNTSSDSLSLVKMKQDSFKLERIKNGFESKQKHSNNPKTSSAIPIDKNDPGKIELHAPTQLKTNPDKINSTRDSADQSHSL